MVEEEQKWDDEIKPQNGLLSLRLKEVWKYRDLLVLFVRRDFVAEYKQTILGPLWYIIQPIFTAYTYYLVLHRMGNMETDGIPPFLFYIAGLTIWTYFAGCLTKTSDTFIANANIFGKVYFPRLIVPLSIIVSNLIKFGLQFILFLAFLGYFSYVDNGFAFEFRWQLLLLPLPIILIAGLSFAMGILISSLTTKYRDLKFALTFGVQLLMFASAVIISFNSVSEEFRAVLRWNPIANVVELFKSIMIGHSPIDWNGVLYSSVVLFVLLFLGIVIFNKTEKTFMDTV